jgi:hypothetical protein
MKKWFFALSVLLFLAGGFVSCSDQKEAAPEKNGAVEEMTDQIAKEAVEKIRTPIEKARSVEDIQQDRFGGIEKELMEKP